MESDDDKEINENVDSFNSSVEKSKDVLRKSFIPYKKRVILQELEPISEGNILKGCSKHSSKGSSSFTYPRSKKILDRMSVSFNQLNTVCSSTESVESESVQPATPPAILRQRIKEAQEIREYLEKELTELQDFTKHEKQILATEKGLMQLQNKNSQLTDQNNHLQLEMEQMEKLIVSQKTLLIDLNSCLDETKNQLENSNTEKDLVIEELENMKRRFVDEEMEKQILEANWKQREDDLKKSLEEAWNLLHIKEEHITKMNNKISCLYSEREKMKNLDLTFGGQLLASEYNDQILNQNIDELFELSCCVYTENNKNSEADLIENSETLKFKQLETELEKYRNSLESHKKQLEELNITLANKDVLISCYEKNLSELEQNLSEYFTSDSVCTNEKCSEAHKTALERMKCDIKLALTLENTSINENTSVKKPLKLDKNEAYCKGDIINSSVEFHDVSSIEFQPRQSEKNIQAGDVTFKTSCQCTETYPYVEIAKTVDAHCQTDINYIYGAKTNDKETTDYIPLDSCQKQLESAEKTIVGFKIINENTEQNLGLHGNIDKQINLSNVENKYVSIEQRNEESENRIILLENNVVKYEQIIKNHIEEINAMQHKISDYEEAIKKNETENTTLQNKLSDYELSIENSVLEVQTLQNKISDYEAAMEKHEEEISMLQTKLSDSKQSITNSVEEVEKLQNMKKRMEEYEEAMEKKEEVLSSMQTKLTDNEESIKEGVEKIKTLLNRISDYEDVIKKNEGEITTLQNKLLDYELSTKDSGVEVQILQHKISEYEETMENKEEVLSTMQIKLSDYEESIKKGGEEIQTLLNKISVYEEAIKKNEEENSTLQNKLSNYELSIENSVLEVQTLQNRISVYEEAIKKNEEENTTLQGKLSAYEQSTKDSGAEVQILQHKISEYEEAMEKKEDILSTMQTKLTDNEESIKEGVEKIQTLLNRISDYEEVIKKNEEEITTLQNKLLDYELSAKDSGVEVQILQHKISEYEETMENKEEVLSTMQIKLSDYEESIRKSGEERQTLLNRISVYDEAIKKNEEENTNLQNKLSDYELTIENSVLEVQTLQNKISDYEEAMEKHEEEISMLQTKLSECEQSITNSVKEVERLQNTISDYEEAIKKNKEEMTTLQGQLSAYEQSSKDYGAEVQVLQHKITDYEETIEKKEDILSTMQTKLTDNEESIKESVEKIEMLLNRISDYDEVIKKNEVEITTLQNKLLDYELSTKDSGVEVQILQHKISEYEENMENKEEVLSTMQIKLSDYEESIRKSGEERQTLLNRISVYDEAIKKNEEVNTNLQNKLSDYELTIENSVLEVQTLQNKISDYEEAMEKHEEEISMLQTKLSECEQSITNSVKEVERLQNTISDYEEAIKKNKEEMTTLQGQLSAYEQSSKDYGAEVQVLQHKITDYEETIEKKEDILSTMQTKLTDNEESIKESVEKIEMLLNRISDYEEVIKKNEVEITTLQNKLLDYELSTKDSGVEVQILQHKISEYEETMENREEALSKMQIKLSDYKESIGKSGEERQTLLNRISVYDEAIKKNEEENTNLQNKLSDYEITIENSVLEVQTLQNKISDYEEAMEKHEEEISMLQTKLSECEQSITNSVKEVERLQNTISDYEEAIKKNEEEMTTLQGQLSAYEQSSKDYGAEVQVLQHKITDYEETMEKKEDILSTMQTKLTDNEESIKEGVEKIQTLLNRISDYEEVIKKNEGEITTLQNKLLDNELSTKDSGVEVQILQHKISEYEETMENKEEVLCTMQIKLSDYEESIKKSVEKIQTLLNRISDYEEVIKKNEEEITTLQDKLLDYEQSTKDSQEEVQILQHKISEYEEAMEKNEDVLSTMQTKLTDYEESIKKSVDEVALLLNRISVYEESIKKNEEENTTLQNKLSDYELSLENSVLEVQTMQNKISEYEAVMEKHEEVINMLQTKLSDCEQSITNSVKEVVRLQNTISFYEEAINKNEEEITALQKKLSDYELTISDSVSEVERLQKTISVNEEAMKKNEEEIITLQNKLLDYELSTKNSGVEVQILQHKISNYEGALEKKEEVLSMMQTKLSDYEESIMKSVEKIQTLENTISVHEEAIRKSEEVIILLQNKLLEYKLSMKDSEVDMQLSQHKISDHEISLNMSSGLEQTPRYVEKPPSLQETQVIACDSFEIVDSKDSFNNSHICNKSKRLHLPEDLNQGDIDLLSTANSYSPNTVIDVEYIDIQASDNTFNVTTLDSTAQLEHSILISKLPQNDFSVREIDPLASVLESFTSDGFETTLTELITEPYIRKNFNSLKDDESVNGKYVSLNNHVEIKALVNFFNNEQEFLSVTFDEISKQFSTVKGMLNPQEDYALYSFCQIIENLVNREMATKNSLNTKILLVNNTLSNLKNINECILELKKSFMTFESITYQDFEIINSHLKRLFMYNRELLAENELLKEQLKVSLHSEEQHFAANEILKNDLNNILLLEKELETVRKCNADLRDELTEKCKTENDINLLIDNIKNLLNPNFVWSDDTVTIKLKQMYSLITESISDGNKELQGLGLLPLFKNLTMQNKSLKDKINYSLPSFNVIKDDLVSLNCDITHLFKKVNSDFYSVCSKLSELYKRQEQESLNNNELKENIKNLVFENTKLKEELLNLKTLNEDLITTSKDYEMLLDTCKNLNEVIKEKDILLSDKEKFQNHVSSFVDSLKDLYFIEEFQKFDSTCKFNDESDYVNFLLWLKKFLKDVHNAHKSVTENIQLPYQCSLGEGLEELCKEKKKYFNAYNSLNSKFHCAKEALDLYSENIKNIKGSLITISSDVVNSKYLFIQDLLSISQEVENLLSVCHEKEIANEINKSELQTAYNLLNEKYSELVVSNEETETEFRENKTNILKYVHETNELKRKSSDFEYMVTELTDKISKFQVEVSDYKDLCHSLERKIKNLEEEKEIVEENLKQYGSLVEYNNLKSNQIKLNNILHSLRILRNMIKESFEHLIPIDAEENFEGNLLDLITVINMISEERKSYCKIESLYANTVTERNKLVNQIEFLNNVIKENNENRKKMSDEIHLLKQKAGNDHGFEKIVSSYSKELKEILAFLNYQKKMDIDEDAWAFIKEKITDYKLVGDKKNGNDLTELQEKIVYLESQLHDAQDFKSKFSKELHLLKPDLDISYLMSLSLAELQKTMIIAIIEKEKDVIADYEMKLASNADRIQQLEEQEKRRIDWVKEMEKENDRLVCESQRIQDENKSLKDDIKLKVKTIIDLEEQLTHQVTVVQMKESMREREESNNQLAIAINEKQTLQLTIGSLNEKLIGKSKECEEMYSSLEKKAKVIFDLEKILSKCKTENAMLEKEVQNLRESMQLNLNNFNDNKLSLEKDLVNYKLQIERLNMLLDNQEGMYVNEKPTLQKEIETETKSVSTDLNDELDIEFKIEGSLNNHLIKLESLNHKIDELNSQLKQQSDNFDQEFKNQGMLIDSLQKELNLANELNAHLKNSNALILKEKSDLVQKYAFTQNLHTEVKELNEQNNLLKNEKAMFLKDKETFEQIRSNHLKNEESTIINLRKEMESMQNKLLEEQNDKKHLEKQIEKMYVKLDSIRVELSTTKEARDDLFKQNLEAEKLKQEITFLTEQLDHCQNEIKTLITEKEISLSECFTNLKLEKEISQSFKNDLEQAYQELLKLKDEKEKIIDGYCKNLQSERDICSKLKSEMSKIMDINSLLENELLCIKNELKEKELQLEEISSNCHLENSCPYRIELNDIKVKYDELTKQLHHESETFKLWKINLEEDLHCKLLKISDLESKLEKETQCYKKAIINNSEVHQKLQESQDKFKRLEEKITMQRDVYIKEKNKSEIDIQNKDKLLKELEEKLHSIKYKCEEFSKDLCTFLEKLSDTLKEDVVDLSSAIILISNQSLEKQRLMEELKEAQEKAEQLEEECEVLSGDIKYHETVIGNLFEKGKMQEEKWNKLKKELENECSKSKELVEKINALENYILSLQMENDKYENCFKNMKEERKALESEKLDLQNRICDLEKSLHSFKNQEIDCIDGLKRELNHLKLELFNKNKVISKLEMRLESDSLPFQKKVEMAERKVEELTKELRILKQTQSLKQISSVLTSPIAGLEVSNNSLKRKEKTIEKLQEDIKQLTKEKSALKLLAQNRRIQIKELKQELGKRDVDSFQDE